MRREIAEFVKELVASGRWVMISNKNHYKLRHVSGKQISTSLTPSDHRSILNIKSVVRKIERGA